MTSEGTMPPPRQANDIEIVGNRQPLIPDGRYLAKFVYSETARVFNTSKVFLYFDILSPGKYFGTRLFSAFRIRPLEGKPRKNGPIQLGPRSDLWLTLCHLYETQSLRSDRPPSLRNLKPLLLSISTRTVTKDYRRRNLPKCEHYSVVDQILSVEEGNL